jgi:hypothetical protein
MDLKPRLVERLSAYIPGLKDTQGLQSSSPGKKESGKQEKEKKEGAKFVCLWERERAVTGE